MAKTLKFMIGLSILSLIFVGCGREETVLSQDEKVNKIQMQFQDNIVECTDAEQIEKVLKMFEQGKSVIDIDGNGWIYKLTFYNENDDVIFEVVVINESTIEVNDKVYKCNDLSLETLDEISGINRYKTAE